MQKRILAVLLVLALGISPLTTAALAEEDAVGGVPLEEELGPLTGTTGDAGQTEGAQTGAVNPDLTVAQPDRVGTLSFANVETRVRENNLTALMLQESIESISVIDFDKMKEDLRKNLNQIAKMQALIIFQPEYAAAMGLSSASYDSLQSSYDTLRDTFDDLKEGKIQEDYAAVVRQLEDAQDQLTIGAETLYITILDLENTRDQLQRNLTALDRTVQEMELRYSLGQISALQLQQVKSGRTQLESGLETLKMNLNNCILQMEVMVGAEQTGELTLKELPTVSDEKIAAMDLEKDLAAAKEASYTLYAAQRELDDAEETYKDAMKQYGYSSTRYEAQSARHTWQAAQYTYQAAVQSYELKFRTAFSAVADYRQILRASETALALQRDTYASMELKYQQGTISQNTLLDAKDDLDDAQAAVLTAQHDLFTAYHTYQWAVERGVLN